MKIRNSDTTRAPRLATKAVLLNAALVLCWLAPSTAAQEGGAFLVEGRDCFTAQGCVDQAADGATVLLGARTYTETITVRGRSLRILGQSNERGETTRIAPERGRYGLIALDARLVAQSLEVAGGYGVYARDSEIELSAMDVTGSRAHGVSVEGGKLMARDVRVTDHLWDGVYADGALTDLNSVEVESDESKGVGIFINNKKSEESPFGAVCKINNVNVVFQTNGGIYIYGSYCKYVIQHTKVAYVGRFGIFLDEAHGAIVYKSHIHHVLYGKSLELGGEEAQVADGILAVESAGLVVEDTLTDQNSRVGMIFVKSSGVIKQGASIANWIGLVVQGSQVDYESWAPIISLNTKKDIVDDGDLPVSDAPSPIPPPPV